MQTRTITILTHGGIIQSIDGVPDDINVEIKAYDALDNAEEDNLCLESLHD